ncbi:unnamed protein product [Chondrus crispus]|uniref:Phosphoglycerate mutase n=1 Tax=Chondrus crispus TaxID=2769 RepID=R7QJX0_CHOCR|nr:unnamed protein product [Chondrus crispus]CDF38822.1 unnamed protein product [Chondrus crispus]|eukprot:XP_005718727.1 unnamed protein product [Chondrus crispus]
MRLLIIRHADPEYVTDSLTGPGKKEAAALAERFKQGLEGEITHIYTSPMGRARATASYTEEALGMKANVEEWTRELTYWPRLKGGERPGEGGLAMWDLAANDVRSTAALERESQWDLIAGIQPAKQPFEELQVSSDAFLARHGYMREGFQYRIVKPNRDIIAVFCHGGFGLTWLAHLLHIPLAVAWTSFYMSPSSVTTILFDERSPDYACPRAIGIGDIGHLYANGLKLSISKYERPNTYGGWKRPSGIKANFW